MVKKIEKEIIRISDKMRNTSKSQSPTPTFTYQAIATRPPETDKIYSSRPNERNNDRRQIEATAPPPQQRLPPPMAVRLLRRGSGGPRRWPAAGCRGLEERPDAVVVVISRHSEQNDEECREDDEAYGSLVLEDGHGEGSDRDKGGIFASVAAAAVVVVVVVVVVVAFVRDDERDNEERRPEEVQRRGDHGHPNDRLARRRHRRIVEEILPRQVVVARQQHTVRSDVDVGIGIDGRGDERDILAGERRRLLGVRHEAVPVSLGGAPRKGHDTHRAAVDVGMGRGIEVPRVPILRVADNRRAATIRRKQRRRRELVRIRATRAIRTPPTAFIPLPPTASILAESRIRHRHAVPARIVHLRHTSIP